MQFVNILMQDSQQTTVSLNDCSNSKVTSSIIVNAYPQVCCNCFFALQGFPLWTLPTYAVSLFCFLCVHKSTITDSQPVCVTLLTTDWKAPLSLMTDWSSELFSTTGWSVLLWQLTERHHCPRWPTQLWHCRQRLFRLQCWLNEFLLNKVLGSRL